MKMDVQEVKTLGLNGQYFANNIFKTILFKWMFDSNVIDVYS